MAKSPIERFSTVFFVAGIMFFLFSFVSSGLVPWLMMKRIPTKSMDDLAKDIPKSFYTLEKEYPKEFQTHYGKASTTSFKEALELGRDIYIAEGCWHCHSQMVRPVSNEGLRFGRVSFAAEYNNVLQMPQLMGTRRVGPDLIREAGLRSNDWHMSHFYNPTDVVPLSVMPSFPWFFTKDKKPNKKGLAIVTYMQWLGSWVKDSTDEMLQSVPAANRMTNKK